MLEGQQLLHTKARSRHRVLSSCARVMRAACVLSICLQLLSLVEKLLQCVLGCTACSFRVDLWGIVRLACMMPRRVLPVKSHTHIPRCITHCLCARTHTRAACPHTHARVPRVELLVHCSQKKRNGNYALVHFHTVLDARKVGVAERRAKGVWASA